MHFGKTILLACLGGVVVQAAEGEGIGFSFHEAAGSGTANVFDGGPPVFNAGSTFDSGDPTMSFSALDLTRPGSLGASAGASGDSWIGPLEDGMFVRVALTAAYFPSLFPGGDNPGGMADAELSSVIEFIMPADELLWGYQLRIEDTIDFEGSTSVVFENVTQSETILHLTSEVFPPIETTLSGNTGDLMRITSLMTGNGSTGPNSTRQYSSTLSMTFLIPEPSTFALLTLGATGFLRRKRSV